MMEGCSTFGSLQYLLPRGGNAVWPDPIVYIHPKPNTILSSNNSTNSSSDVVALYADDLPRMFNASLRGHARTLKTMQQHNLLGPRASSRARRHPRSWTNPLVTPLRTGRNTPIYCLYSIEGEADMAYHYVPTDNGPHELPLKVSFDHGIVRREKVWGVGGFGGEGS